MFIFSGSILPKTIGKVLLKSGHTDTAPLWLEN